MNDRIYLRLAEQLIEMSAVAYVGFNQVRISRLHQLLDVAALHVRVVKRIERIDNYNLIAPGNELLSNMASNKPGSAGNENLHSSDRTREVTPREGRSHVLARTGETRTS